MMRLKKSEVKRFTDKLTEGTIGRYNRDKLQYTMVEWPCLWQLAESVMTVIDDDIPGDFIECGVWRGGCCILMAWILDQYGITDRKVFVADSFQGIPKGDAELYPRDAGSRHHKFDWLKVSRQTVENNFSEFGLLKSNVCFVEGFFRDTMPVLSNLENRYAILRLDGDIYESTMVCLEALEPQVSDGGFLIVDDHKKRRVKAACKDYYKSIGVKMKPLGITKIPRKQLAWWRVRRDGN